MRHPSHVALTPRLPGLQRVVPIEAGEASEVRVVRAQRRAMLDGVCSEDGVRKNATSDHRLAHQVHHAPEMTRGGDDGPNDWELEPGFHHRPGSLDGDCRCTRPRVRREPDEAEQPLVRQRNQLLAIQPALPPFARL